MSNTNTGGPAPQHFPSAKYMSLRDYFAAKAMPFIQWNKDHTELCAARCYEIADAMLKAREQ
jgi:hypothetical protein